jgi:hypothetical protein
VVLKEIGGVAMLCQPLFRIAIIVVLGAAGGCSGEYTPPSRAIAQDVAATSAGGGGTTHLSGTTTFRDSDLAPLRR